jgi:hypothetical protein
MTEAAPQAAEFVEAQFAGSEQRAEFSSVEEPQATAFEFDSSQQSAQEPEAYQPSSDFNLAPTAKLPETFQPQEPPAPQAEAESATAPAGTANASSQSSQPGQIGLEQLSPEAIEAIARRVVEHLSAPVIEQIAWEVVPQLAELLIKRRLEEEGKQ